MADTYQMFIGGKWVNSASGETRSIASPATGEVLAEVQEGSAEDVDRAVGAAGPRSTRRGWTRRRASARRRC